MGEDFCQIIRDWEFIAKNEQPSTYAKLRRGKQRTQREKRTQRIMKKFLLKILVCNIIIMSRH